MSHDQNFKNLILDYPRQALQFFAQAENAALDQCVRITPIRQEQLKDRLGDRFRELDVPLRVEWPKGEREALLFVIEEESDPRHFSIHRLAHYCLDLAELCDTERVVPVVIFLREGSYPRKLTLGGERGDYLRFHYLVCDLPRIPAENYRQSDNIVARLNLPNMQYSESERVEIYADAVKGLVTLEADDNKQSKYIDFIDIYAALDDNELARYERDYLKEVESMTGLAQKLRQEGRQQGMQQGMQQGEAAMLIRLLQAKFGSLPEQVREKIESTDAQTLLKWSERVLTANSLEDIYTD